jgi:tetratricopeptide (TPR) repeat protein
MAQPRRKSWHPQAVANLGMAYNTAGEPNKAIAIFENLLQRQPDNPSVILNLGFACQDAGLIERAVECFRRVIAMTALDSPHGLKARQGLRAIRSRG